MEEVVPEEELVEELVEPWQIRMTQVDEDEMVPQVVTVGLEFVIKIPLAIRWHSTAGSSSEDAIRRAHLSHMSCQARFRDLSCSQLSLFSTV